MTRIRVTIHRVGVQRCALIDAETGRAMGEGRYPPVIVSLGKERIRTTLIPVKGGDFRLVLPVKALRTIGADTGSNISFDLEPDPARTAPELPDDLRQALEAGPAEGLLTLEAQTVSMQRQVLAYVDAARTPETRAKRIARVVDEIIPPLADKSLRI